MQLWPVGQNWQDVAPGVSEYSPLRHGTGWRMGSGQKNPGRQARQCVPLENSPRTQDVGSMSGEEQDWP